MRRLVAARRRHDPNPDDPFRGLYLSEEVVTGLLDSTDRDSVIMDSTGLDRVERDAADQIATGTDVRLLRLSRDASLTALDVELLVIAMLPDLDVRFERLYGYLNDDVTRRRASVALALQLAGVSELDSAARGRLEASRPLLRHALLNVEDADRPLLTRGLRVPDRVTAHLLGDDAADPALLGLITPIAGFASPGSDRIAQALARGVRLYYLMERGSGSGPATAVGALEADGRGAVTIDLARLARSPDPPAAAGLAVREALLRGEGLVAWPVEQIATSHPETITILSEAEIPVLLCGSATWDPLWSVRHPVVVEAPSLVGEDRTQQWTRELNRVGKAAPSRDLTHLVTHLALGPSQIRRAVETAATSALLGEGTISADDLRRGVRAQNAAGLERLTRRSEPEVGWDDLVLPTAVRRALTDLTVRARHRDQVLSQWRMRRGGGRGRGVIALFAGESGTGKTMSAEVIAGDLGLDLYTVNLATVVDKYIGETEKNLERIFAEAAGVNAVLFFDEADAIFGKRSDVKDAHDRYANIESAYLLQRLETFDGLAVLATNLRSNIDEAFVRRLDAIIDFPSPSVDARRSLWERCLAPPLPIDDDLDLAFLAEAFELAGGNIRSASTTAAYLAAGASTMVTMQQVITAVEQEYRKLGRLVLEREFGRYYAQLR
ncbi:MAG: ATP-binding protein [Microlunatus sp.]|nr:ATP-binding protein [Microlunatus sp.]